MSAFDFEMIADKLHREGFSTGWVFATFSDGLAKAGADRYTLLWLEKEAGDGTIRVRALGGDGLKDKGPAETRKVIEDPASGWSKIFGDPLVFRLLKDN